MNDLMVSPARQTAKQNTLQNTRQNQLQIRLGASLLLAALLTACSNTVPAPVERRLVPQERALDQRVHEVRRGETLYSIAFAYGLDFRELARWNGIGRDYKILVGQKLALEPKNAKTQSVSRQNSDENVKITATSPPPRAVEQPSITPKRNSDAADAAKAHKKFPESSANKDSGVSSTTVVADNNVAQTESTENSATKNANDTALAVNVNQPLSWQWPGTGRMLGSFSAAPTGLKGVNIAGKTGEPVRAAATGQVVYAGSGLRGYGQMVIIKHNEEFLSAYAHASRLHVQENDVVKAGQVIADIGSSGTDREQLHFQIRYQGQPVDPLKFLPKR